jgi:hypothetical protein
VAENERFIPRNLGILLSSNKGVHVKKSFVALTTVVALFAAVSISAPANAAISGGASCPKAGSTTKVGTKSYQCAKNPYLKSTKISWTLKSCFTAYALWADAKQQYSDWKDIATLSGPEGVKTLADLQTSIDGLEQTMKTQVCKKGA